MVVMIVGVLVMIVLLRVMIDWMGVVMLLVLARCWIMRHLCYPQAFPYRTAPSLLLLWVCLAQ
jgi:hypothetical protein